MFSQSARILFLKIMIGVFVILLVNWLVYGPMYDAFYFLKGLSSWQYKIFDISEINYGFTPETAYVHIDGLCGIIVFLMHAVIIRFVVRRRAFMSFGPFSFLSYPLFLLTSTIIFPGGSFLVINLLALIPFFVVRITPDIIARTTVVLIFTLSILFFLHNSLLSFNETES